MKSEGKTLGKIKKILAVAMISTMAFSMAGCKMISKTPEAIQKTVLATIGNDKILLSDVDNELKPDLDSLKEKYGEDYESKIDDSMKESLKEARTTVLDQLVEEKIMLEKADELGLRPSDEELSKKVDEKIEELTSYYGDEDTLNSVKESYGYVAGSGIEEMDESTAVCITFIIRRKGTAFIQEFFRDEEGNIDFEKTIQLSDE